MRQVISTWKPGAALCTLAYAGLWAAYAYLAKPAMTDETWIWVFVGPPFVIAGGLAAMVCFGLEFGDGLFHYSLFLLVTLVLRRIAGMSWL